MSKEPGHLFIVSDWRVTDGTWWILEVEWAGLSAGVKMDEMEIVINARTNGWMNGYTAAGQQKALKPLNKVGVR